jgi:hypothetical protein
VTATGTCARGAWLVVACVVASVAIAAMTAGGCGRASRSEAGATSGSTARSTAETTADLELAWRLDPQPARVGPATLIVTLRGRGGEVVRGATVRIEGHMTHPGMAPILARASERAPGEYAASLDLNMAGDWVLLVCAQMPDGRRIERRIDLAGVRPTS